MSNSQNLIREYGGVQYTVLEGANIIKELNDRTKSNKLDYNSIEKLATKVKILEDDISTVDTHLTNQEVVDAVDAILGNTDWKTQGITDAFNYIDLGVSETNVVIYINSLTTPISIESGKVNILKFNDGSFDKVYVFIGSTFGNYGNEQNQITYNNLQIIYDEDRKELTGSEIVDTIDRELGNSGWKTSIEKPILRRSNNSIIYDSSVFETPIVGGFYYPRKAVNPDWVSEMVRTDIVESDRLSWGDIENDLDYLVNTGVNTVRIVIQTSLTTFGTNPLVYASNNYTTDLGKSNVLNDFAIRCKERGLKIITQTNFGYEGALSESDISEMEDYLNDINIERFNNHLDWVTSFIDSYKGTIIAHKMFNEPDGFGTWSNYDDALTILKFLFKLKERFVNNYNDIPYICNAVTHDNFNMRFTEMPVGQQSLYDLSDWSLFNSYYWGATSYAPYFIYALQWDFMVENNYDNKPIMMSECGYPSDYDNQVYVDDNNQDESFVPANGQFDRPIGNNEEMPHTQESQNRSIREAVYYSQKNNASGILCWSLFKHHNRTSDPNFFQDSFGLIDETGLGTDAYFEFVRAFKSEFASNGTKPLSITNGIGSTNTRINGIHGYQSGDVICGILIPKGDNWKSDEYDELSPYVLNVKVAQQEQPVDNGISIGFEIPRAGQTFLFQYEDYSNRWRFFLNGEEVAATLDIGEDFGTSDRVISFDFTKRDFGFYMDGVLMYFKDINDVEIDYNINFNQQWHQYPKKIICNASTSVVEVKEANLTNDIPEELSILVVETKTQQI